MNFTNIKILCIIPARSGSKGIPNKNIKLFNKQPLLYWSISQAQQLKYNVRILLSTDSEEYRKIAIKYGAEVPFLRPKEISDDTSTDYEFIKHAIDWYKINKNYIPDVILQLRPTYPTRNVQIIDECLTIFLKNRHIYDSLRTVIPTYKSPYKMYVINDTILTPLFKEVNNIKEPYNQCRQILPKVYLHNGYIDILNTSIVNNKTISGNKIYPYIMSKEEYHDIDTIDDWEKAENI